jgi:nucleotide-binding universal stress UspA family protein
MTELTEEARQVVMQSAHEALDGYVEEQLTNREGIVNRKSIRTAVDFGDPAERILALAKDVNANLIVLGTHSKTNSEKTSVGSVTQQVLRESPCSVLVVRVDDEH